MPFLLGAQICLLFEMQIKGLVLDILASVVSNFYLLNQNSKEVEKSQHSFRKNSNVFDSAVP